MGYQMLCIDGPLEGQRVNIPHRVRQPDATFHVLDSDELIALRKGELDEYCKAVLQHTYTVRYSKERSWYATYVRSSR